MDTPSPDRIRIAAFYKFVELPDFADLRPGLADFCCAQGIRGTVLLAPEGINGTVAGSAEAIAALVGFLKGAPRFAGRLADLDVKYSSTAAMPFYRMKVREKKEIVSLRSAGANPAVRVGEYVVPQDWNALISKDDVRVIDTRNDYEVGLGSFAGAEDPQTATFSDFKTFVAEQLNPARDKKIAMFCTGGIRCEKASSYLLSQGFTQVFHLKGGILRYLEEVKEKDSLWRGECFVFDERVTVTHGLDTGKATLCRACRQPLTHEDRADALFEEGVQCPRCAGGPARSRQRAAERQKQIRLAAQRGLAHLGDDAREAAARLAEAKKARRAASRAINEGGAAR